jgi:predicted SAM-dependent methyltransferase
MTLKLHLGCGPRILPGYIHVDIQRYPHVKYVCDVTKELGKFFEEGSVDEIYACHILEHISRKDIIDTLSHWSRLLRVGGKLRLAVPDFEAVVKLYMRDPLNLHESLLGLLYGGQRNKWDYHTMPFDFANLNRLLKEVGFSNIERYHWQDFLPSGYDDYSRCYLPDGQFETGELMSLNVIATKSHNPRLENKHLISLITKKPVASSST